MNSAHHDMLSVARRDAECTPAVMSRSTRCVGFLQSSDFAVQFAACRVAGCIC